jgi:hypothetical protein
LKDETRRITAAGRNPLSPYGHHATHRMVKLSTKDHPNISKEKGKSKRRRTETFLTSASL